LRRRRKEKICPVCGEKGVGPYKKWVLNEQKIRYEPYYYMAHYYREGGVRKIHWCYIGKRRPRKRAKRAKV